VSAAASAPLQHEVDVVVGAAGISEVERELRKHAVLDAEAGAARTTREQFHESAELKQQVRWMLQALGETRAVVPNGAHCIGGIEARVFAPSLLLSTPSLSKTRHR